MTDTHDAVRRFYAALARGDVPGVLALLDPAVEWTEAERFPYFAGTWHGPDEIVRGLLEPLGRDWTSFKVEADAFVAEGDEAVAFGNYVGTHRRTGRSLTAPFAHRWTVRDGRIVRFVQYTDTAKVLEAVAA